MSDLRELARTMALCEAYRMAKEGCDECGRPAERQAERWCMLLFRCGTCAFPQDAESPRDLQARKAIQRLMRIASVEDQ